ncbi:DUF21 domain-containing protein, partial [bacterium]|nr:DUF21 domain-containing protein [bacterium]
MIIEIFVLIILIIFSFTFSGSETALFSIKSHQLADLKKTDKKLHDCVNGFLKNTSKTLLIILISNTLVNLLATSLSLKIFQSLNIKHFELWNFLIMSFIIILFGEIFPKTLALEKNISFFKSTNLILKIFAVIIYPIIFIINGIDIFFMSIINKKFQPSAQNLSKEELFALLYKSNEMRNISKDENIIYKNFIRLLDRDMKSLVIYRGDIIGIDINDKDSIIKEVLKGYKKRYISV